MSLSPAQPHPQPPGPPPAAQAPRPARAPRPGAAALRQADLVPNVARAVLGLVEDQGHEPEALCRGLGFSYQDLLDRDLKVSHHQTRLLVQRAQRLLKRPDLGLAAGARQSPVSWGVPGLGMMICETYAEAITHALTHQAAAGSMVRQRLFLQGQEAVLELAPRVLDLPLEMFVVEETLACHVAVSRHLVGAAFKPLRVDLAYPRPAHAECYRQFFDCPVNFDADAHRAVYSLHWGGMRLAGYDRITCGLLRAQLDTLLPRPVARTDLVESLANHVRVREQERPRQRDLAQKVNLSERTLRRRLSHEQTSYRSLRDEALYQQSRELLAHSTLTVAQVASAVGYSDARAFRRAFARWSGQAPADFRQAQRSG